MSCTKSSDNKDKENNVMQEITFNNRTSYKLNIYVDNTIVKTDAISFSVNPVSTTTINSEYGLIPYYNVKVDGDSLLQVKEFIYQDLKQIKFSSVYLYDVEYDVTGTADKVNITITNSSGENVQYNNASLPQSFTYSEFNNKNLYVSAENLGETGNVTVSIYLQGELYKTSTASEAYSIATASGTKQ